MLSPVLWKQNPDPCSSVNKTAESGRSHKQMIFFNPPKSRRVNVLEDLTVLLTERTLCHPTPLEATAQHQMPSFILQLQDSRGPASSPRSANRAQSGSLTPCKALRKNKPAFVRGRPTMTAQAMGGLSAPQDRGASPRSKGWCGHCHQPV